MYNSNTKLFSNTFGFGFLKIYDIPESTPDPEISLESAPIAITFPVSHIEALLPKSMLVADDCDPVSVSFNM